MPPNRSTPQTPRAVRLPGIRTHPLSILVLFCLLSVLPSRVVGAEAEKPSPADGTAAAPVDKPEQIPPAEKLRAEQQRIAEDFQHLQDLLLRMAELSELADPRRAALLKKAVHESERRLIGVQFESLVELLEKAQLSRAMENRDGLEKDLQALLDLLLSENRAKRVASEKTRVRAFLKRLNQIINGQKDVQARTAGRGLPGPLADQQQGLADKTADLADDVRRTETPKAAPSADAPSADAPPGPDKSPPSKPGAQGEKSPSAQKGQGERSGGTKDPRQEKPSEGSPGQSPGESQPRDPAGGQGPKQEQGTPPSGRPDGPKEPAQPPRPGRGRAQQEDQNPARPRIEAAEARMREAEAKLREAEREGAVEKQEEAIRQLEEAKAELERILRQLREEEIERMLTLLDARFRKMLQLQREVHEGTVRLDEVPAAERSSNDRIEARRLARREDQIIVEADRALTLLRDDGSAVAFPEALGQIREDMEQVAGLLDRAEVGPITQTIEEEIITALEEMLESVQRAQKEADRRRSLPMPAGPPRDPPLVDRLAEIKMIRAMQLRVNRRTERYRKLIEGEQADLIEALARLAEQQARIHRITRDLEMGENR